MEDRDVDGKMGSEWIGILSEGVEWMQLAQDRDGGRLL
jgi:hypothetical protein